MLYLCVLLFLRINPAVYIFNVEKKLQQNCDIIIGVYGYSQHLQHITMFTLYYKTFTESLQ